MLDRRGFLGALLACAAAPVAVARMLAEGPAQIAGDVAPTVYMSPETFTVIDFDRVKGALFRFKRHDGTDDVIELTEDRLGSWEMVDVHSRSGFRIFGGTMGNIPQVAVAFSEDEYAHAAVTLWGTR